MGSAGAVDAGESGVSFGEQVSVAEDFVAVDDFDVGDALDGGAQSEEIVVECGTFEFAADVDDHEEVAGVFDVAIGEAGAAEQLGAALLEVDEEGGVVEEAHTVGFGVADADFDFVGVEGGHGNDPALSGLWVHFGREWRRFWDKRLGTIARRGGASRLDCGRW